MAKEKSKSKSNSRLLSMRSFGAFGVAAIMVTTAVMSVFSGLVASRASVVSGYDQTEGYPVSIFNDYGLYPISNDALFDISGNINANVMNALVAQINAATTASSTTKSGGWRETNNADFSSYVTSIAGPANNLDSGSFVIKLFETVSTEGATFENLTGLWYQVVYRTQDDGVGERDVLTLWAIEPYRTSGYASAASNLATDYTNLTTFFTGVDQYFTTASDLPGEWQKNTYQTGTDTTHTTGCSTFGHCLCNANYYVSGNGVDYLSETKFWLPSSYEVVFTGSEYDPFDDAYETYVADAYDGGFVAGSELYRNNTDGTVSGSQSADIRHGLWALNGYDRAFDDTTNVYSALRTLVYDEGGATGLAAGLEFGGVHTHFADSTTVGIRPALHLDIKTLTTPAPTPVLGDLYYYMHTLKRILGQESLLGDAILDYTVTNTSDAEQLVADMEQVLTDALEGTFDQDEIDGLVEDAIDMIVINTDRAKTLLGIITQMVGGLEVEFTEESWLIYEAAINQLLAALEAGDEKTAIIKDLEDGTKQLSDLLALIISQRATYLNDWVSATNALQALQNKIKELCGNDTITDYEAAITGLITNLNSQISALQQQISDLETDLSNHQETLETLVLDIVESRDAALAAIVVAVGSQHTSTVQGLVGTYDTAVAALLEDYGDEEITIYELLEALETEYTDVIENIINAVDSGYATIITNLLAAHETATDDYIDAITQARSEALADMLVIYSDYATVMNPYVQAYETAVAGLLEDYEGKEITAAQLLEALEDEYKDVTSDLVSAVGTYYTDMIDELVSTYEGTLQDIIDQTVSSYALSLSSIATQFSDYSTVISPIVSAYNTAVAALLEDYEEGTITTELALLNAITAEYSDAVTEIIEDVTTAINVAHATAISNLQQQHEDAIEAIITQFIDAKEAALEGFAIQYSEYADEINITITAYNTEIAGLLEDYKDGTITTELAFITAVENAYTEAVSTIIDDITDALDAAHATAISDLESTHATAITNLQSEHDAIVLALQGAHEDAIEGIITGFVSAKEDALESFATQYADYEDEINATITAYNTEIAGLLEDYQEGTIATELALIDAIETAYTNALTAIIDDISGAISDDYDLQIEGLQSEHADAIEAIITGFVSAKQTALAEFATQYSDYAYEINATITAYNTEIAGLLEDYREGTIATELALITAIEAEYSNAVSTIIDDITQSINDAYSAQITQLENSHADKIEDIIGGFISAKQSALALYVTELSGYSSIINPIIASYNEVVSGLLEDYREGTIATELALITAIEDEYTDTVLAIVDNVTSAINAAHATAISELESTHATAITNLQSEHDAIVLALQGAHEDAIEGIITGFVSAKEDALESFATQYADYEDEINATITAYNTEIAGLLEDYQEGTIATELALIDAIETAYTNALTAIIDDISGAISDDYDLQIEALKSTQAGAIKNILDQLVAEKDALLEQVATVFSEYSDIINPIVAAYNEAVTALLNDYQEGTISTVAEFITEIEQQYANATNAIIADVVEAIGIENADALAGLEIEHENAIKALIDTIVSAREDAIESLVIAMDEYAEVIGLTELIEDYETAIELLLQQHDGTTQQLINSLEAEYADLIKNISNAYTDEISRLEQALELAESDDDLVADLIAAENYYNNWLQASETASEYLASWENANTQVIALTTHIDYLEQQIESYNKQFEDSVIIHESMLELYFYKEFIKRIIGDQLTDYEKIMPEMQQLVDMMESAFVNGASIETVERLVTQATMLMRINTAKFEKVYETITEIVEIDKIIFIDGTQGKFTDESWELYQESVAQVKALLEEIEYLNTNLDRYSKTDFRIIQLQQRFATLEEELLISDAAFESKIAQMQEELSAYLEIIAILNVDDEEMSAAVEELEDLIEGLAFGYNPYASNELALDKMQELLEYIDESNKSKISAIDLDAKVNEITLYVSEMWTAAGDLEKVEESNNRIGGIDAMWVGIIIAVMVFLIGVPMIVFLAGPRRSRAMVRGGDDD